MNLREFGFDSSEILSGLCGSVVDSFDDGEDRENLAAYDNASRTLSATTWNTAEA